MVLSRHGGDGFPGQVTPISQLFPPDKESRRPCVS